MLLDSMKKKVAIGWSSGKDSAYAAYTMSHFDNYELAAVFTTYNSTTGRLPIQGTRIEAVREQARAIGLPLIEIDLPENCPNEEYERRVVNVLADFRSEFQCLAFGDLFLDGIKEYRESFLKPAGFEIVFPLMGSQTKILAQQIIYSGIRAKVCSVDSTQLDTGFIGREYNEELLNDLPANVDPCGERGEFHTFVYSGPIFKTPPRIELKQGKSFGRFTFLEILAPELGLG
jgi:uncharacterized protein (TIGR00290 family)